MSKWDKYYKECPATITDGNGVVWTSEKEFTSGSINWVSYAIPRDSYSVYCTPYFDDCDGIPLEITNDGDEVLSKTVKGDTDKCVFDMLTLASTVLKELV